MNGRAVTAVFALLLTACATAGPRDPAVAPVPVYTQGDDLPCEYDALGPVHAVIRDFGTSEWALLRARDEALGRAAAVMGADAVLVPDTRAGAGEVPFVAVPEETSGDGLRVEGTAIRWKGETCAPDPGDAPHSDSGW